MQKNHLEIILETIQSKMDAVLEIVADQPTRSEFNELKDKVDITADDVSALRVGMTMHSRTIEEQGKVMAKHSLNLKRLSQNTT